MTGVEMALLATIAVLAALGMFFAAVAARGTMRQSRLIEEGLRLGRAESGQAARDLRIEVVHAIGAMAQASAAQTEGMARQQKEQLQLFAEQLRASAETASVQHRLNHEGLVTAVKELRGGVDVRLGTMQTEAAAAAKLLAETVNDSLKRFGDLTEAQSRRLFDIQKSQHESFEGKLTGLTDAYAKAGESLREGLENQLKALRTENGEKLEAMRLTVDEKLQDSLDRRLGESFKVVSDRLEAVHKGLGEMQTLATGVGDLKRVLSNVKARGTWGEVQLGALLEQTLTPAQYRKNVITADTGADRVEFAIVLPGQGKGEEVLLPIDAKFPIEDYERLQAAAELGDLIAAEAATRALEQRLKASARDIATKYVHPPRTTDFAIMFLPTEGLYAEAIRRPGLTDELQRLYRVSVAGPTTLTAILSSLQMGFRTLAIQERSSEVWKVLGAVKTEFEKFAVVLSGVKKKLDQAARQIETAETRNRTINRKLREVEALPIADAELLLGTISGGLELDIEDAESEERLLPSAYFDADDEVDAVAERELAS
ncbi:MAG: rmuC [Devosia sp.]|nr:rmuC [Devosia sp.]